MDDPGKGLAIGSLVLGIIGLLTGWVFGLGCILGIVGVVLAVVANNKNQAAGVARTGLATAGIILGILAIVGGAGCLICTVCSGGYTGLAGCAGMADSLSSHS